MEFGINGRAAAVAASSKGLGFACALELAREGASVAICSRDAERIEEAAAHIRDAVPGARVHAAVHDLSGEAGARTFVEEAAAKFGRLDILVTNSGGPTPGSFDQLPVDRMREGAASSLMAPIAMIYAAVPHMRRQKWGRVVNIASIHALNASPWQAEAVDAFVVTAAVALLFALLTVGNLTAFLVHDERRDGRARVLRLATIDGRRPVAAHLSHASLLALPAVAVGLVVPGAYCVAAGLPLGLCLMVTLAAGAFATISGVVGLWIGYLLPRLVAILALQLTCFWLTPRFATSVADAVQAGRPPLVALAWLLGAHLLTFLVLSPLWRRTSARLW